MKNTLLAMLTLSVALFGCESPAIGDWESTDAVANEKNELTLEDDETGEATIHFFSDATAYRAEFELEWTEDGDTITMDMECQGDCSGLDFEMECTLNSDDDEMECEGDNVFSDYEFDWKRD